MPTNKSSCFVAGLWLFRRVHSSADWSTEFFRPLKKNSFFKSIKWVGRSHPRSAQAFDTGLMNSLKKICIQRRCPYFLLRDPVYFRIQSELNDSCLDMAMGKRVVVLPLEDGVDAQLWYEDNHSFLRNKANHKVLDNSGA